MATLTKTFKENGGSYKSTWTLNMTLSDYTVSSKNQTLSIARPTNTAKYVYSGKSWAIQEYDYSYSIGGVSKAVNASRGLSKTVSGTTYTLSSSGGPLSVSASNIFNSSNPSATKVAIVISSIFVNNESAADDFLAEKQGEYYGYVAGGTVAYVNYNCPLDLSTITSTTTNTSGYYWKNVSTASVNIPASIIPYGGGVSSATLTIGEQTATITNAGTLSIKLDTAGTFTPSLTVTDTRGKTATKQLAEITVQEYQNISANWGTVQPSTNGYYAGKTTATVTVSNINVMSGFNVTSAQFIVGSEKKTISSPSTDSVTFSLPLTVVGTFTPQVKINTDAYVTTIHSYPQITVNEYVAPSVTYAIERSTPSTGKPDIGKLDVEGESALLTTTFTYINDAFNLLEPTVTVTDENGAESATITWYTSWNSTSGASNPVNWTSYNPTSPVTLYGVITGYGTHTKLKQTEPYQISVTPRDTVGSGTPITQMLPQAFYTIDFKAGGKEIAFGGPADDDLTNVNGKNYSSIGLFKCDMGTAFNDMTTQEISDFVNGLDYAGLNVADYVVDQGSNGIWTYRKWDSGICDLWGVLAVTSQAPYSTSVQFGYWYSHASDITFPFPIKNVSGSYSVLGGAAWAIPGAAFPYSHANTPNFITTSKIYCLTSQSGAIDITYKIIIHGRWK